MKIACYYFSGTGNTKFACEKLMEALRGRGAEADLYRITANAELPAPTGYDCLVIGYPVHGFNAPTIVLKFLKKLPKGKLPCYLVRTSGEPLGLNDASGITPKRILRKKGYLPRGEFHYVMPYNIIFRHSDGMAARMLRGLALRIPADADLILGGGSQLTKVGALKRFVSFACRIEHPAMPHIGRHFHATEDCIGCGKCEKICPLGNIRMENGKPKFGKSCVGCMGCAFSCPKDAIRTAILNGWRVNGAYSFEGDPAADDEVCSYCKKSYLRYFHAGEDGQ